MCPKALQRPTLSRRLPLVLVVAPLTLACVPDGPAGPTGPEPEIPAAPTVFITAPSDGARFMSGDEVEFTGEGADPDEGALEDATFVWTSSLDGELGTGPELKTKTLTVGEHQITLALTDAEGHTGTDHVSIEIENHPPTAEIRDPDDGDIYRRNREIRFRGKGDDFEDGKLEGEALVWTSSLDGEFGTGEEVKTRDLSSGTHTITLTATDSHGDSATDEIEVVVLPF